MGHLKQIEGKKNEKKCVCLCGCVCIYACVICRLGCGKTQEKLNRLLMQLRWKKSVLLVFNATVQEAIMSQIVNKQKQVIYMY